MDKRLLEEAFRALREDEFSIQNEEEVKDAQKFLADNDEEIDIINTIIDANAETEEDLEDSYVGKIILECNTCKTLFYKDENEVEVNGETGVANETDICPVCMLTDGYSVIGKVEPFCDKECEDKKEEKPLDESIDDVINAEEATNHVVEENGKITILGKDGMLGSDFYMEDGNIAVYNFEIGPVVRTPEEYSKEDLLNHLKELEDADFKFIKSDDIKDTKDLHINNTYKVENLEESKSRLHQLKDVYDIEPNDLTPEEIAELRNAGMLEENLKESFIKHSVVEKFQRARAKKLKEAVEDDGLNEEERQALDKVIANFQPVVLDSQFDKDGAYVLVGDKNSTYKFWMEISEDGANVDWNQYIFNLKNSLDLEKRYLQNSADLFDIISSEALNYFDSNKPVNESLNANKISLAEARAILKKAPKKCVKEDFQKVDIETDTQKMSMESDENGKVTVTTEPKEEVSEVGEEAREETIAPLTDEEEKEMVKPEEDNMQEVEFDEFEEKDFDELGESYLKKVYENVKGFKTIKGTMNEDSIMLEGIITFNSGKEAKTNFIFRPDKVNKDGKVKFLGENLQISKNRSAFALTASIKDKKIISEKLQYHYYVKDVNNKGKKLYGVVSK